MQRAFEDLRAQFAWSILLIHPDEESSFIIYTDASKIAIGALLLQTTDNGETRIVSTASRVLSPAELLAVVPNLESMFTATRLSYAHTERNGRKLDLIVGNLSFMTRFQLHPSNFNREGGFTLGRSWDPAT
ncbi:uncharacterized protein LOC110841012 [Zootermopsis nevadensis]|uniref:uncharacterized protein LOC110841012 n=1 Tax=Zootermopsis nevadensis TaxID=136037 RepID=UPI000B8E3E2A|nr:uncharacterized protein LOC110841012 [Zootermopsis nevadensis]